MEILNRISGTLQGSPEYTQRGQAVFHADLTEAAEKLLARRDISVDQIFDEIALAASSILIRRWQIVLSGLQVVQVRAAINAFAHDNGTGTYLASKYADVVLDELSWSAR